MEEKHLPTELFSTFNLSSYLTWRLGPHYRDFADGRYFPFGRPDCFGQLRLASLPLDSDAWSQAACNVSYPDHHLSLVALFLAWERFLCRMTVRVITGCLCISTPRPSCSFVKMQCRRHNSPPSRLTASNSNL